MNSQSFSQTATDTSYVLLPKSIAQEIIRELILKDNIEKEVAILYKQIKVKDSLIISKDEIIRLLESRVLVLQEVNYTRMDQLSEYRQLTEVLEAELRKEKFRKRIYQFSSTAAILGIGAVIMYYESGYNIR